MKKNKLTKLIALGLTLILILSISSLTFSVSAETADIVPDWSWYAEGQKEFHIQTMEQLAGISHFSNSYDTRNFFSDCTFILDNDIVFNEGNAADWATNPPAKRWLCLDWVSLTLDGNGHTISGIYCKGSAEVGLFGISIGLTVKNLNLVNSYFESAGGPCAAIAAHCYNTPSSFINLYVDAIVKNVGNSGTGMINGRLNGTTVTYENIVTAGSLNADQAVGSLVGNTRYDSGTIGFTATDCISTAAITVSEQYGGGMAGCAHVTPMSLTDCVFLGTLNGPACGPVIGGGNSATITINNYYTNVSGNMFGWADPISINETSNIAGSDYSGQFAAVGTDYHNNIFSMRTGAAIRTNPNSTGLRWITDIDKSFYEMLSGLTGVSVQIGTIIAPNAYATSAGGMTEAKLNAAGKQYLDVVAYTDNWFETGDNVNSFAGSVANITDADHFNLKYAACGYMTITFANDQKIILNTEFSAADHARTIAYVANAALNDTDSGLTQTQKQSIQAYADAYNPVMEK